MKHTPLRNALLLACGIVLLFLIFWETYLRSTGIGISYDDGPELWTHKRSLVTKEQDRATVFIGSSRNKYDLDIETWRSLTGEDAIQLAFEGTSPMPVLDDLANDHSFKGKLMIDVTEMLLFSTNPDDSRLAKKGLDYYKNITPAQWFSFQVNKPLESQFVFLERDYFSIKALLKRIDIPTRAGMEKEPLFPIDFGRISFDRQNKMSDKFLKEISIQDSVKNIWSYYSRMGAKQPPPTQQSIDSLFQVIQEDVQKITSRGGKVIFVRTPSSGVFLQIEQQIFPREHFWNRILSLTGAPGIHFMDYPEQQLICPEDSHLSPTDAITYTKSLVKVLETEKGWSFPNKIKSN